MGEKTTHIINTNKKQAKNKTAMVIQRCNLFVPVGHDLT